MKKINNKDITKILKKVNNILIISIIFILISIILFLSKIYIEKNFCLW